MAVAILKYSTAAVAAVTTAWIAAVVRTTGAASINNTLTVMLLPQLVLQYC